MSAPVTQCPRGTVRDSRSGLAIKKNAVIANSKQAWLSSRTWRCRYRCLRISITDAIAVLADLKLAFVGMAAAADRMPSELSGGMRKRAALARALALDPEILFFDEPSAGLDPVTSNRLDDLIVELSNGLGATVVIVSHELPSLFAICDDGIFLDGETGTAIARGSPRALRDGCAHPTVRAFMERGQRAPATATGAS